MADIGHRQAFLGVKRRLEREDRQQMRDGAHDAARAPAAPGPDGRADVLDRGNAGLLEFALEVEIEIGGIHADEHRGPLGQQAIGEPAPDAHDLPVVAQHFGVAAHAQLVHGHVGLEPFGDHLRAADAGKAQIRTARFQRRDQVRGEQVARRLRGHHADVDAVLLRH